MIEASRKLYDPGALAGELEGRMAKSAKTN
jgi:hypothetical protein